MHALLFELAMLLVVLTGFAMITASRLGALIRYLALQGALLGAVAWLAAPDPWRWEAWAPALGVGALKGWLLPALLRRALALSGARREIEPLLGFTASLWLGVGLLAAAFWIDHRLPPPVEARTALAAPAAYFTLACGLLLLTARRKAITQVAGYLVLENGVYAFGATVVTGHSGLFELGILLDVVAGAFVMGIAIFQISRTFDHIDVDRMAHLREAAAGMGEYLPWHHPENDDDESGAPDADAAESRPAPDPAASAAPPALSPPTRPTPGGPAL